MKDKEGVRRWWTENPMTYGNTHGTGEYGNTQFNLGTHEFFERLDYEFYQWAQGLHDRYPFDRVFPYDTYSNGAKVLEIGCGLGTMAMNWAKHGACVTAIDLNPTSVAQTKKRFALFGLEGNILEMDANQLLFPDRYFDYVYSWGVLHHSPNLELSLNEMMRVLRPEGKWGLMLYNRASIMYRYRIRYLEGFLHYENRFLGPLELASRYTDGRENEGNEYTWPVLADEIRAILAPYSSEIAFKNLGPEVAGILKYMIPGIGHLLPQWAKKAWARRLGWSLWGHGRRARNRE